MECLICLNVIKKDECAVLDCCGKFLHLTCLQKWRTQYKDECPHCRQSEPRVLGCDAHLRCPKFIRGSDDVLLKEAMQSGCHIIYTTLPEGKLQYRLYWEEEDDGTGSVGKKKGIPFESDEGHCSVLSVLFTQVVEIPSINPYENVCTVRIYGEERLPVFQVVEDDDGNVLYSPLLLGKSPGIFSFKRIEF